MLFITLFAVFLNTLPAETIAPLPSTTPTPPVWVPMPPPETALLPDPILPSAFWYALSGTGAAAGIVLSVWGLADAFQDIPSGINTNRRQGDILLFCSGAVLSGISTLILTHLIENNTVKPTPSPSPTSFQ